MKITRTNQKNDTITELVLKLQTEIKKNEAQMNAINEELEKNPRYSVAELEKIIKSPIYTNELPVDDSGGTLSFDYELVDFLKDKKKVQEILK